MIFHVSVYTNFSIIWMNESLLSIKQPNMDFMPLCAVARCLSSGSHHDVRWWPMDLLHDQGQSIYIYIYMNSDIHDRLKRCCAHYNGWHSLRDPNNGEFSIGSRRYRCFRSRNNPLSFSFASYISFELWSLIICGCAIGVKIL